MLLRIKRLLWPNHCPRCGRRFSEWFFWPSVGDYWWPCYDATGKIFARKPMS